MYLFYDKLMLKYGSIFNSSGTLPTQQPPSSDLNQQLNARFMMTNPIASSFISTHSSPSTGVGLQLKSKSSSVEQSPSLRTMAIKQAASKQLGMGDRGDSLRWAS